MSVNQKVRIYGGGIHCPKGYDCNGDEDGLVWLCEKWTSAHEPTCQAYGLHAFNLTMDLVGDYMFAGINVNYRGHNHMMAHVRYHCDQSLSSTQLVIRPAVELDENMLYIHATSRLACPIGSGPTPTPPPQHSPHKPVKPAVTPVPIRSPNPHHVVTNDTHVAIIDWQRIQQPVPSRAHQIIEYIEGSHHYYGTSHTTWWAWNPTRCPPGYVCPESDQWGNYWVCWFDEAFQSYCHPAALKTVPGSRVELKVPGQLDSGFYLTYEGAYKTHLKLNVSCVPWGPPNTILFAESTGRYYYNPSTQKAEWSYDTASAYVCPHPLIVGAFPSVTRSPPPPKPVLQNSEVGDFINGQHVGINLKKFEYLQGRSVVGYETYYHWAEWHYSPWELIGCPKGLNCGVYVDDLANIWKCVGANTENCFPIGDKRYNLSVDFLNHTNELAGIKAVYGGGADDYSVQVDWQCNDSVEYGTVYFNHIVTENLSKRIVLWAHTHEVCPDSEWGQVRPGAVFLLIVGLAFFVVFVLGTLVKYVVTGAVSLLFDNFWSEVSDSLTTAVVFLVTCGKGQSVAGGGGGKAQYNDI
jgi:hypothetical protein